MYDYFVQYILRELPPGIRGLMAAGLFATAMGSLSTALNALATSFTRDFYLSIFRPNASQKQQLAFARLSTVSFALLLSAVGVGTAWVKLSHPEIRIIPIVLGSFGYTYGSLLGIFLLGMTTKSRGSCNGNLFAMLAGFLVVWGLIELATITSSSYGSVSANQQPNSKKAIDINVTGQQWVWTFEYPGQEGIASEKLVVPIDTPLYFNVTSVDVIHNFWVVELGIKIDANPGAITNTGVTPNKLGTFNIRCAELCGMHHAYMETEIQVVTQEEFDAWVRDKGGKRTA